MDIKDVISRLKNVRPIERRVPYNNSDPDHKPTQDDLEQAPLVTVGYRANCPGHKDEARSLTISPVKNQQMPSFSCSRGCAYGKIMEALGLAEEVEA